MSVAKKKDSGIDKKTEKAARPKQVNTAFGDILVSPGGSTVGFSTKRAGQGVKDLQAGINNLPSVLNGLVGNASKPFDVQSAYDNPMYQTTYDLFKQPIDRQYEQDQNELTANLNARGQMGSSFDALMRRNLMQGRDYNLNQASLQGRQASFDAYNQSASNALAQLAGLTGLRGDMLQQYYYPMAMAQGQQQAINPLQTAQIGYNSQLQASRMSQPTWASKGVDLLGNMMSSGAQGYGAGLAKACWVAREAYGVSNPKWIRFRKWLLNSAPTQTRDYYLAHGPAIARRIKGNEAAKANMRAVMDSILEAA
jgi:hypothetical protein